MSSRLWLEQAEQGFKEEHLSYFTAADAKDIVKHVEVGLSYWVKRRNVMLHMSYVEEVEKWDFDKPIGIEPRFHSVWPWMAEAGCWHKW